jgi:colanic acid/amylovoran biosynthesis protein
MADPVTLGLKGVDPHNLGSHLMALAVRDAFPDALLGMPARAARPHLARMLAPAGVWLWTDLGGPPRVHRVNRRLARATGSLVVPTRPGRPHRVDAVLDISGFAYGGPFATTLVHRLPQWMALWRRRDIPAVLLPQSFGPFPGAAEQRAMRLALERAALVFAREETGARALEALGSGVEVRRAPDIAIGSALRARGGPGAGRGGTPYAVVLPNRQVARKTDMTETAYLEALVAVAERCRTAGLDVVVASHEGPSDMPLAEALGARVAGARVQADTSLPALLGTIRHAELVVSSRFHGLVAALANGVPVLSVGWADKYRSLLEGFGVVDAAVEVGEHAADLHRAAVAALEPVLADPAGRRETILAARALRLAELDELWAAVRGVLVR